MIPQRIMRTYNTQQNEFSVQTKFIVADFREGRPVYKRIGDELKDIPVGILVNNVGMFTSGFLPVVDMTEELMWDMVNVNIAPVLIMTKMLLPRMKKNHKGAIVNISSMSDLLPMPLVAVYAATKVFVRNFTKALQHENRHSGVTIQLVSPGVVRTNMSTIYRSKLVHPNELLSPPAQIFVGQAIGTLGVLDHTAGYTMHNIITGILELLPECMKIKLSLDLTRAVLKSEAKRS